MMDGMFGPAHMLVSLFFLVVFGLPFFLVCRWIWRKGSK